MKPRDRCPFCNQPLTPDHHLIIFVASTYELLLPGYLRVLASAMRRMGIGRRRWRDVVSDVLYDFKGLMLKPDCSIYVLPDVDDVFGDDFSDRWISAFLNAENPKLQKRTLERVRLIDLFFRIAHPEIAATFRSLTPVNDNTPASPVRPIER